MKPKQIRDLINAHRNKARSETARWDKFRGAYMGDFYGPSAEAPQGSGGSGGSDDLAMETNFAYAFADTAVANICPTNPEVNVMARREAMGKAARYREALVNDTLDRIKAHTLLWRLATLACVYPRSFVKAVWNFRRNSPDFIVRDPRYVWFDQSAGRWEDIRYLVEVTVLTQEEFERRSKGAPERSQGPEASKPGADPYPYLPEEPIYDPEVSKSASFTSYPSWLRDSAKDRSSMNETSRDVLKWTVVYEVYDFSGEGRYYHFLEDAEDPLFMGELPYRFVRNPFQLLTFNDNLNDIGGVSDVKLIWNALERLNELDTLMLWHAQTSIPMTLLNTGLCDNTSHTKSQLRAGGAPGTVVDIKGKQGASIRDIIAFTETPGLTPEFQQQRDRLNHTIEFVLGIPAYSRGVVGVTDVATEVALADTATRTRNGRRQTAVNDIVKWMAQGIVGLYEEFMAEDDVLPVRLTDATPEIIEITRASMQARELLNEQGEEPMQFDYKVSAYSPAENNRLTQLRNLSQFLPVLIQSPAVDKTKLTKKLLELLQMEGLMVPPEQLQAQMAQGAAPIQAPPGPGGAPPPGEDPQGGGGAMPTGDESQEVPKEAGGAGHPSPLPGFGGAPFDLPPGMK
tara:strand:- start:1138 stop:3018 length:1881 start_codon:yes stop_codon:yes gene_type:complete